MFPLGRVKTIAGRDAVVKQMITNKTKHENTKVVIPRKTDMSLSVSLRPMRVSLGALSLLSVNFNSIGRKFLNVGRRVFLSAVSTLLDPWVSRSPPYSLASLVMKLGFTLR